MKHFITDTHPLVWYFNESRKLPTKIGKIFDRALDGEVGIWVPIVSLLEISLLDKRGKIQLRSSFDDFASNLFHQSIVLLDLLPQDILNAHSFNFSNDFFDNLIVAMAQRIECPLITGDAILHKVKPCRIFWG